jgi:TfoX/Sxy family transcriptional regulator of competence genes
MSAFKTVEKLYDEIWAQFPEIERKGKTMPYTSMNGNMFSFVSKIGELAFRLSDEVKREYISAHGASESIQHGRVMKGYINVPEKYFDDAEFLKILCEKSIQYAKTLRPKATKKKK